MVSKKRFTEIDVLRGLAILMVILYHSIIVYPVDLHEIGWCRNLHSFLWVVQMPLFFLVSGFCYSYDGHYGVFLLKKVKRILIPHIVFCLLEILPRIIPNPFVREQMDLKEALYDFAFHGGGNWFLWTLFLISALFPLLAKLLETGGTGRAIGLALAVFLYFGKESLPGLFLLDMAGGYLLYYMLGYFMRQAWEKKPEKKGDGGIAFFVTGLVLAVVFFMLYLIGKESRAMEFFCAISAAGACLGMARFLTGGKKPGVFRSMANCFLINCSAYSLQMYLLDAYALVFTRTVLVNICQLENPVLIILGNFLPDLVIVLFVSKYILTKVKVFRILCGIPEK